ncbi:MAG: hypothetical protein JWO70_1029 [Betaproteobacteria bacterium]|nr:hypothetical protein [Betaproteobacteria bacterium]
MIFAYLVFGLLPIAGVAYIIWDHRRKAAQREAASAGRMEELLVVAAHAPRAEAAEEGGVAGAGAAQPAAPPASFALRDKFLTPPQTLLYYLLKTGLPEHLVFTQVPVGSLLDAAPHLAPYAREEQARMFARHVVDFAIFDKSTRPVAVVNFGAPADAPRAAVSQMKSWFTAANLRYVELDPAALPRKDAVRALILEADSQLGGSEADAELAR